MRPASLPLRCPRALLSSAAFILALGACPGSVAGTRLPAATGDPWLEARTARFRVYTNADASVAVRVARHLERLADVLRLTTRDLHVDGGREVRVYAFRDLESFRPYRPYGDDQGGVTAGFHSSGDDAEHIAFFVPAGQLSMRFASHEYLHAVIARSLGELPVWVNEGLAEFYSTFEARHRHAEIGLPIPEHVAWLQRDMIPLPTLLRFATNSPEYQAGDIRPTLYAQSWALTHLLEMDPAGPSRFELLLSELGRGTTSLDALRIAYGPNAADSLQRRLREYVSLLTLPAHGLEFSEDFDEVPVATRPLDAAETCTVLGELLLQTKEELAPLAREHLETAWDADSTRALPAALLGALAERRGDREGASRWFAAVRRSGADDPRALGIVGSALARRRLRTREPFRWPAPGATAEALEARSMLARVLESRPEAAEWLTPFALTFLDDSGVVQEGIGALLQAQEGWPRRADIVGALSMLNLRAGNRGAALAMYQRIPPGMDRAFWRISAGDLIESQTMAEVRRLSGEGPSAEAESLVVRLRRTVTEPGVASDCDEMLGWLHGLPPPPSRNAGLRGGGPAAPGGGAPAPSPGVRAPPPTRAHLDSLAADARNQKRLRSAEALVSRGSAGLACALYDMILNDRPSARLRREVERLKARLCAAAGQD